MTKKIVIVFVFSLFVFSGILMHKASAGFDCLTITANSAQSEKDYCKNELVQIEAQLADLLARQKEQQKTTGTLKGDVGYLTSQINTLKKKIQARSLAIAKLKADIEEKVNTIGSLSDKIDREHESLAQLLRNTDEFDEETIVHLMLSDKTVSNFFSDLESYASIKQAVKQSVDVIIGVKADTEAAKTDLETKQNAETDAKAELESAQKTVVKSEADKKTLLNISKNQEAVYARLAADKKKEANKIRNALFQLRDTGAISFGVALAYAKEAASKTNVSPAFLLAIITQESNLGTDIGSCYLNSSNNGSGVSSTSGKLLNKVMHPTRDIPPFLNITSSLGLDPYKTPVSCPIGGSGYGGAMGPAQFIASTWIGIKAKLVAVLGVSNPDPWQPKHAFMASALFLSDLGATSTSYSSEIRAACKYYGTGGSTCAYGRNVMSRVSSIQNNINLLSE